MQPLIGITTSTYVADGTGWEYNRAFVPIIRAVERAGGLPVLIPLRIADDTLRAIYARLDGVLLPGGGDVRPSAYQAEAHPLTGNIDDRRDQVEISLAQWAVRDDQPVLGICRGHQVLNVALGGTLVQDIPSQVTTTINHDGSKPRGLPAHDVTIDPASRLAGIIGSTRLAVNSLHHQSVEQPAPDMCVTAHAPDGVIEGLEMPDKRFVLSVQWHPEDMFEDDPAMLRIFQSFVGAAGGSPTR